MALLAVGLVGFGTGNFGGRTRSLGSVGGKNVSVQAYANALTRQMRAFEEQIGQPLTFAQAQSLGLDRAVLAQVVTSRTLDAEVDRLGLSVGDERVAEAVLAVPAFQGIDGAFDRDLYAEQLRRNGLDEETFETSLREDTTRALLQAAIVGGVPTPDAYAEAIAGYQGERRVVTWAVVAAETLAPSLPAPTDEELRAYYDANPGAFTTPEVREISYAWLAPEMIRDDIVVDPGAVRDLYDSRIEDFVQEERRLVERLVLSSDETAQDARARLDAGEVGFEDLVEERGLALSDVDLGDVPRGELGAAGEAVFAAGTGEVVGPLPTDLGPALFRVNAVLAADEVTFEEAEPDLRAELADEAARRNIDDAVAGIEDLVAGGAAIEDLAERTELEPGTIDWSEGQAEGIAAYDAFREAAAAAEAGAAPEIVALDDGGVFALRLDGVTPPALRPYEDVQGVVVDAVRAAALREAVAAEAQTKAEAIAGGATFEAEGLAPATEPPLTRRDVVEGTPPEFMTEAFALGEGGAASLAYGTDAVVLRVDSVEAPAADDPAATAEREAIAEQAAGAIAQDLFAAFATELQAGTEVRIDDAALSAVNAQFE